MQTLILTPSPRFFARLTIDPQKGSLKLNRPVGSHFFLSSRSLKLPRRIQYLWHLITMPIAYVDYLLVEAARSSERIPSFLRKGVDGVFEGRIGVAVVKRSRSGWLGVL